MKLSRTPASCLLTGLLLIAGCSGAPDDVSVGKADYATRCAEPSVIQCFGFDIQSEIQPHIDCGAACPAVDLAVKASGAGSLKMTIPSRSGANTSGYFTVNFTPGATRGGRDAAYLVQFGEGEDFYVQWRQRFSEDFLNSFYRAAGGWKQAIIGEGDRPGVPAYSCTQLGLVVQNSWHRGYAQMYHSCGGKDGDYEHIFQNWSVDYEPDQWMTFQVHVKIGTWYKNNRDYRSDSLVEMWVAEEGEASRRVVAAAYDLANNNPEARYGKVWLLPYNTGKDPNWEHPVGHTWYDELIISRSRIPDPL